jgi:hypothetical protein
MLVAPAAVGDRRTMPAMAQAIGGLRSMGRLLRAQRTKRGASGAQRKTG